MNNNIPLQSFTEMKKKGELIAPKKIFLRKNKIWKLHGPK